MNRTAKSLLAIAIASLIPTLVYSYFDPGFALFVAPILLVFTFICASFLWFFLKWIECSERNRSVIVFLSAALWSIYIGVSAYHSGHTAEGRFKRLLFNPIPESVRFIDHEGFVAMAGGYEVIVFAVSPSDLDAILNVMNFKSYTLNDQHIGGLDNEITSRAEQHGIHPRYAYRTGEGSFLMLLANESRDRVLLYRFRL